MATVLLYRVRVQSVERHGPTDQSRRQRTVGWGKRAQKLAHHLPVEMIGKWDLGGPNPRLWPAVINCSHPKLTLLPPPQAPPPPPSKFCRAHTSHPLVESHTGITRSHRSRHLSTMGKPDRYPCSPASSVLTSLLQLQAAPAAVALHAYVRF